MAIITGSALGRFRNKVGNVVTAKWLNKNVARIYVDQVSNPNTNKQKLVRARFSAAVKMAAACGTFLRTTARSLARSLGMTIYGLFVKLNWESISASSPDDVTIDFSSVVMTQGSIETVNTSAINWGTSQTGVISTTWSAQTPNADCDDNDEVYLCLFNPVTNKSVMSGLSTRSMLAASVNAPTSFLGIDCHLYLAVVGKGETTDGRVSDSVYLGHGEVQ